eukprot:6457989-Amphidinium_carterae.1
MAGWDAFRRRPTAPAASPGRGRHPVAVGRYGGPAAVPCLIPVHHRCPGNVAARTSPGGGRCVGPAPYVR